MSTVPNDQRSINPRFMWPKTVTDAHYKELESNMKIFYESFWNTVTMAYSKCPHEVNNEGIKYNPSEYVANRLKLLKNEKLAYPFYDRLGLGLKIIGCLQCAMELLIQTQSFITIFEMNNNIPNTFEYIMSTIKFPSILSQLCIRKSDFQRLSHYASIAVMNFNENWCNHFDPHRASLRPMIGFYFIFKIQRYRQFKWFITADNGFYLMNIVTNYFDDCFNFDYLFVNNKHKRNGKTYKIIYFTRKGLCLHLAFLFWKYRLKLSKSKSFQRILCDNKFMSQFVMRLNKCKIFKQKNTAMLMQQDRMNALKYLRFCYHTIIQCSNMKCGIYWVYHKYRDQSLRLLISIDGNEADGEYNRFMLAKTLESINKWYKCKQCKIAYYCSRKCQKYDWKCRHKNICIKLASLT
eukprot:521717_1